MGCSDSGFDKQTNANPVSAESGETPDRDSTLLDVDMLELGDGTILRITQPDLQGNLYTCGSLFGARFVDVALANKHVVSELVGFSRMGFSVVENLSTVFIGTSNLTYDDKNGDAADTTILVRKVNFILTSTTDTTVYAVMSYNETDFGDFIQSFVVSSIPRDVEEGFIPCIGESNSRWIKPMQPKFCTFVSDVCLGWDWEQYFECVGVSFAGGVAGGVIGCIVPSALAGPAALEVYLGCCAGTSLKALGTGLFVCLFLSSDKL